MDVKEAMALIQGTPLQLGRKVYVCPALNIKGMRMFSQELALLQKGLPNESIGDDVVVNNYFATLAKVAEAALLRNYPDITANEIEEGIDFNNLRTVTLGVLGASGFKTNSQSAAEDYLKAKEEVSGEPTGTV